MLDIIVKGISLLIVGFVMINLAIEIYTKVTHENFIEGLTGDLTYNPIEYESSSGAKYLTLRTQASGGSEQTVDEEGAKEYCNTRDSCLGYVVYDNSENNVNAVRQNDVSGNPPYVSILSKKHVNDPRDLEIVKTNFEDKNMKKFGYRIIFRPRLTM